MELTQYLAIARRWWWLLIAGTIAGALVAYAASGLISPTYEASATLRVTQQATPGVITQADIQTSRLLAESYSQVLLVPEVLVAAVDEGDLPVSPGQLAGSLSVDYETGTDQFTIHATASDAVLARDMANAAANAFISSDAVEAGSESGSVDLIRPAGVPGSPTVPDRTLNAMLGGLLAIVVIGLLVVLFDYLDDTIKSAEQVMTVTGLPTLGRLATFRRPRAPSEQLQVTMDPQSTAAEDLRTVRMNLTHALRNAGADGEPRKIVLFTGTSAGEGTSTVVANLAAIFGAASYRVVVVDVDLRNPTLHEIFRTDPADGFMELLSAPERSAADAARKTSHPNVWLLPSGRTPLTPSDWLGSERVGAVMNELAQRFDIVLLDSSAAEVTDPSVLAASAHAVVIVAQPNKTKTRDLRAAAHELTSSGTPIVGVVLNRTRGGRREQVASGLGRRDETSEPADLRSFREGARRIREELVDP